MMWLLASPFATFLGIIGVHGGHHSHHHRHHPPRHQHHRPSQSAHVAAPIPVVPARNPQRAHAATPDAAEKVATADRPDKPSSEVVEAAAETPVRGAETAGHGAAKVVQRSAASELDSLARMAARDAADAGTEPRDGAAPLPVRKPVKMEKVATATRAPAPIPKVLKAPDHEVHAALPGDRPRARPVSPEAAGTEQTADRDEEHAREAETKVAMLPPLPSRAPQPPKPKKPPTWTAAQIAESRDNCARLVASTSAMFETLDPIKTSECGAPAAVKLQRLGKKAHVSIMPVPTVRCRFAVELSQWMREVVQPAARRHLGTSVKKLHQISGYVCRHRYGNPKLRISEHAFADALDVAVFDLANGDTVSVDRDFRARHAAATSDASEDDDHDKDGAPAIKDKAQLKKVKASAETVEKGSKKEKSKTKPLSAKALFLNDVHDGACRIFGTTLGPEANAAHHNHFHLDGKVRRSPYCE